MGKKKKKVAKLSEEEYFAYIMSLKDDAPLFNADGEMFIPENLKKPDKEKDY